VHGVRVLGLGRREALGSCADLCCRASCLCHGHVAGFSSARKDAPAAAPCLRACLGRPSMTCAQYAARSAVRAPPRPATRCAPTVCCPRAVTLAAPRAAPAHLPVTVLSPVRRCPGAGRGGRAAHGARRALLRAARDPEEPGAHPVPVGHPVRCAERASAAGRATHLAASLTTLWSLGTDRNCHLSLVTFHLSHGMSFFPDPRNFTHYRGETTGAKRPPGGCRPGSCVAPFHAPPPSKWRGTVTRSKSASGTSAGACRCIRRALLCSAVCRHGHRGSSRAPGCAGVLCGLRPSWRGRGATLRRITPAARAQAPRKRLRAGHQRPGHALPGRVPGRALCGGRPRTRRRHGRLGRCHAQRRGAPCLASAHCCLVGEATLDSVCVRQGIIAGPVINSARASLRPRAVKGSEEVYKRAQQSPAALRFTCSQKMKGLHAQSPLARTRMRPC